MKKVIRPEYYKQFILGGNAEFVLYNSQRDTAIQYMVQQTSDEKEPNVWFIKDRTRHILLVLTIHDKPFAITAKYHKFDLTRRKEHARFDDETKKQVTVFEWFWWEIIVRNREFPHLEVQHIGKCGCCGRKLTDETSVDIGIGPDCRKKLGIIV